MKSMQRISKRGPPLNPFLFSMTITLNTLNYVTSYIFRSYLIVCVLKKKRSMQMTMGEKGNPLYTQGSLAENTLLIRCLYVNPL